MGGQQETDHAVEDHQEYDELMEILENPAAHQEKLLAHILSRNAEAEYLLKHKVDGATDVKSFKEKVPISDYDDYKPYVDRILEGDKSPLLAGDPVTEILTSTGTSRGVQKMFPTTNEEIIHKGRVISYNSSILQRLMPEAVKGKSLALAFARPKTLLACGLPCCLLSTSFFTNPLYRQGRSCFTSTTPPEVFLRADGIAGMYCHLLLGLVQRDEVVRFLSIFPTVFIKAMRCLEEWWPAICEDIANGTLSTFHVKDEAVRTAVLSRLTKDPNLAELLIKEFSSACGSSSWDGIVPRIWPNIKAVDVSCTAAMEPYFGMVSRYAGDVPVICSGMYVSTEGSYGIVLDPTCPANKTRFTLFPESAYYEFIPVVGEDYVSSQLKTTMGSNSGPVEEVPGEVLDLMSVKEGQLYEILVTTLGGLYRYRMGDVLKVVGYYKSNPTFQLLGRTNVTQRKL